MTFFKKIWNKLKRVLQKGPPSTEKIVSDAKTVLENKLTINDAYAEIESAGSDLDKEVVFKKIARQIVAKEIIDYVEAEPITLNKNKKRKKRIYELHELNDELQALAEKAAFLNYTESKIHPVTNPDTSSVDSRINNLFTLIRKNKFDDQVKLSDTRISSVDDSFKQFEKLLIDKSAVKKYRIKEAERQRKEMLHKKEIRQKLTLLETLITQTKIEEARFLIGDLNKSIKPNYEKELIRLNRAKENFKTKEFQIFKKRQEELLKQQAEEAKRIKELQEQKAEEQRIIRERRFAEQKVEEEKKAEKLRKLKALLNKKSNWRDFQKVLQEKSITILYHFTDHSNLKSIRENGGLYSWYYCDINNIVIPMPGGSLGSRQNDTINGKKDFVRVSFSKEYPMLYVAKKDGRIQKEAWLHIDIEVAYFEHTEFSDKNAAAFASYRPKIGKEVCNLENIRFDVLRKAERIKHYNLPEEEKPYNQAEVLVKTWIPLEYITNIDQLV